MATSSKVVNKAQELKNRADAKFDDVVQKAGKARVVAEEVQGDLKNVGKDLKMASEDLKTAGKRVKAATKRSR